jgi:hypothetical protein
MPRRCGSIVPRRQKSDRATKSFSSDAPVEEESTYCSISCANPSLPGCLLPARKFGAEPIGPNAGQPGIMNATNDRERSLVSPIWDNSWKIPGVLCFGMLGMMAGCASDPESHVLSAPPPPVPTAQTTTTTTTTGAVPGVVQPGVPATSTTVVTTAPPALQQEVVLAQPSQQHVWIAGYWTWRDGRYEWVAGRWVLPPNYAVAWVPPRWEREGTGYRFYEGYWR